MNEFEDDFPDLEDEEFIDDFDPDAHCCSAHDDGLGYCEICGAAIFGTYAYRQLYGGE